MPTALPGIATEMLTAVETVVANFLAPELARALALLRVSRGWSQQ